MSVPNSSYLAGLEVAEKFVWCLGEFQVKVAMATVSNLNASRLELSWVSVGF